MTQTPDLLTVLGAAVATLTTDTIFVIDAETLRVVHANAAFSRVFGYSVEEAASLSMYDLIESEREVVEENLAWLVASGELTLGVRPYRRKDGGVVELDSRVGTTVVNGRTLYCVVSRDATGSREAERSLRESEQRFHALAEAAFEGIAFTERGHVVDGNQRLAELLGAPLSEVIGRPVLDFVATESRDKVERHFRTGRGEPYSHDLIRVDGRVIPVEVQAKSIRVAEREIRVTAIRDISVRRNLEEQLRLAQRMESVGRLAGGVAHDFNNILTVILSLVDILSSRPQNESDLEDLQEIGRAAERAAQLTGQLLAFARKQIVEPKLLDLNDLVRDIEKMLRRLIGEDIELVLACAPKLGRVRADPGQIGQVLMNLAVNARDAMPAGGTLTLETGAVVLGEDYVANHPDSRPGEHVVLSVSDTGAGMDRATLARVFEPFFSTKEAGKGTGLGLAVCYGIVKQSGGSIWAYSEPGRGTTFKIYLPTVDGEAETEDQGPAPASRAGVESVLLVEDDDMVRSVALRVLSAQGYRVSSAANGAQAIALFTELGGKVDLLVTDVVMPQMSGKALADELLRQRPTLKVLYTSGYTENTIVHQGIVDPGIHFLEKPYVPAELARRVRRILDGVSAQVARQPE
jgi:PAS domain S-box-containing protein